MRLFSNVGLIAVAALLTTSSVHAEPAPRPRPTITTTIGDDHELHIVVHGVTDYCKTDAETQILRTSETIRILHERPRHASRCIDTQDLTFVVKDVTPGRYTISYERMPLVAPARPITVASTTMFVR